MKGRPWVLPLGTAGLVLMTGCASLSAPVATTTTRGALPRRAGHRADRRSAPELARRRRWIRR